MEEKINIQQALFFSFLQKTKTKKQKKIIDINFLITVILKMKLLIFVVFSQYELALITFNNFINAYFLPSSISLIFSESLL